MAFKDRLYGVPVVGTGLRVQDRYKEDAGNQLAAAMGFFGFLSLFPVLLLALSVAGFVLADEPARQAEIVSTIERAIPGLSAAAGGDEQTVVGEAMQRITENPGAVGLVGLVTLLLTGLRVVDSAMTATERVFRVRIQQSAVKVKLRQLGALVGLGLLALVAAVIAASVGALADRLGSPSAGVAVVVAPLLALALDFVLFLVAYRVLAAGQGPSWRQLVPGALFAAVGWTALKVFGATYVAGQVARTNELYGTLGGVIGLLLLLFLAGRLYLYGAELTAVLRRPGADLAARDPDVELRDAADEPGAGPTATDAAAGDAGAAAAPATQLPSRDAGPLAEPSEPPDRLPGRRPDSEPLPPAPDPDEPSPAVSAGTAELLVAADARNAELRDPHYVRKAIAFTIAVGAVGGLVSVMRPGPPDEDG